MDRVCSSMLKVMSAISIWHKSAGLSNINMHSFRFIIFSLFCCSHEGNFVWFNSRALNQYQYIFRTSQPVSERDESGMQLITEIMKCTYCECTISVIRMLFFDPLNFEGGKGGNSIFI